MDLSIVIPAYEEGHKIARDVTAAAQFFCAHDLRGEIIVVDDGSSDNTTQAAQDVAVPEGIQRRVLRYEAHRGKGYGVRTGMVATSGQYAMFADCGLCIPYDNVLTGLELLRSGACDIAHGSRRHIQSSILRDQPWHRRLISRTFKATVRTMLGVPREFTDTQCGFKIYRGDVARELYGQCVTDGFLFDIEILLRAIRKGYRVREFPVQWACDRDTRLSVARTPWPVLSELRALRRAMTSSSNNRPNIQKQG
ncbi:MAG: glycosyltransferase [Planctomycetes bacterium]|nr:glycosyltransferase [Planctomycetota bacterium]